MNNYTELRDFLQEIAKSRKSYTTTPQHIVNMLGYSRRSWRNIEIVEKLLKEYNLSIEPDFDNTYCYAPIEIKPLPKSQLNTVPKNDPIPRLSRLKSANLRDSENKNKTKLIFVRKETSITEVITLMALHKVSQLPILSGDMRVVEGMVSWRSITKNLFLGKTPQRAYDCREDAEVVHINTPLFKAVGKVLRNEVILVRDFDNVICGIVTAINIAEQFTLQFEPFFLIEQIERIIRHMLEKSGESIEGMKSFLKDDFHTKEIESISDLTFGQYIKIMENKEFYNKLNIAAERKLLIEYLDKTRMIRNEIMHFATDGISNEDKMHLRKVANFLFELNNG